LTALTSEQVEALADLVADRLARQPLAGAALVDVATVADYLAVERGWVYEHAHELGARRLGSGPKAPLRFSLREVDERLRSCSTGRGSRQAASPIAKPNRRRQRAPRLGTGVELLPIKRGRSALGIVSRPVDDGQRRSA